MPGTNSQHNSVDAAFKAYKFLETNKSISLTAAAEMFGTSRAVMTGVKLIMEFGTLQEQEDAQAHKRGIRTIVDIIRPRLTPEERHSLQGRNGPMPADFLADKNTAATIWAKLKPALQNLSALPSPTDTIKMIKGSSGGQRIKTVNKELNQALKWLQEFSDEWTSTTEYKDSDLDSGGSNEVVGTQHPEPTTE